VGRHAPVICFAQQSSHKLSDYSGTRTAKRLSLPIWPRGSLSVMTPQYGVITDRQFDEALLSPELAEWVLEAEI
jgi:hypothetical protein